VEEKGDFTLGIWLAKSLSGSLTENREVNTHIFFFVLTEAIEDSIWSKIRRGKREQHIRKNGQREDSQDDD
jgi:hypothetical protein